MGYHVLPTHTFLYTYPVGQGRVRRWQKAGCGKVDPAQKPSGTRWGVTEPSACADLDMGKLCEGKAPETALTPASPLQTLY